MNKENIKEEQILIRLTGQDRPGLTASVMGILAQYDAQILDIGQADIHSTLSLGILIRIDELHSGQVMKELLFKASELNVNIGFAPVTDDEYEDWVGRQDGSLPDDREQSDGTVQTPCLPLCPLPYKP